uniref:MKI67 FHA domain-interacting nucleolar phosphoprotein-like n=1 Tax=Hirondellea gigas TaxID=1518452 RepID=A0A2P2I128_9CRUS
MAASIELANIPFTVDEKISLEGGASKKKGFRKYTLPQNHKLLRKLQSNDTACVFIQGLPFGMVTRNLKLFMKQFGYVERCKVHSCPRSGKSKGFGYVQFRYSNVAEVVTKTMDNYLLLGNIIKSKFIPGQSVKDSFFSAKEPEHHMKVNLALYKNNAPRDAQKEQKLLKKRQEVARRQLAKLESSLLQEQDLGISKPEVEETSDEDPTPRRCLVLLRKAKPAKKGKNKSKFYPQNKKVEKTKLTVRKKANVKRITKKH